MHYRDELAYIHHRGFSEFAESAAAWIVALLAKHRVRKVVEVGCGSGVLARELTLAGFEVLGFDASPAMIALARQTAPAALFEVATIETAHIPPCDAVIAIGEVLNYGTFEDVRTLVARAANARVLLFDAAERGAYPASDEQRVGGEDWSAIIVDESDGVKVTRRILTFRQDGEAIRRDEEVHLLELHDRAGIVALLREHRFRVQVRRSYGGRRLPAGNAVYVGVRRGA